MRTHIQSLYRSPLKTGLTLLLLAAAAFLFLYNLSEYSVSLREYQEARDKYEGVLTVDLQEMPERDKLGFDYFLITDPTNPGRLKEGVEPSDWHQPCLDNKTAQALSALPYVTRIDRRYMTAGVSDVYWRLDTDHNMYNFASRCVIVATIKSVDDNVTTTTTDLLDYAMYNHWQAWYNVALEDIQILAGPDDSYLWNLPKQTILVQVLKPEYADKTVLNFVTEGPREAMLSCEPVVFQELADNLIPGRSYAFVLRCKTVEDGFLGHELIIGDDSLTDWWFPVKDVTDLPDNWLETEEFAALREVIQVTKDDLHTFDVVYGDDMTAIRRVSQERIICEEGRFLTPADAGQSVCVVSTDLLETYDLEVGDSITLRLGNYLCEQYAPLGAVASNKGRYATEFKAQTFTIIGSWRDLNEGGHVNRDLYWCWSNNAIFVPSAFLPDCVNADTYNPEPPDLSFIVENAEEIVPFMEKALPLVEEMGLDYEFSDGGWTDVAADLMRARDLALVKLLIFSGAAVFALVLTVWLFIGRKKQEYGILRALGMPKERASRRLLIPFLLLGFISALAGLLSARLVTIRQLTTTESAHATASFSLLLLGALGFLVLQGGMALVGLLLIRRKSILELTQEKRQ